MIYGYLRVSSDEQDVNSQKQGVESFAKERGWTIEEYITDEGVSGGKNPDKRNLGPLLKKLIKGDVVICSEISRLGRDLYMIMDILHFCMERGCIIYTVKDRFTLGDDIQSKVLAFAFGLAAEIERQMIRQRTKEGLRLRMKMGVLLGRPYGGLTTGSAPATGDVHRRANENKEKIIEQFRWGVPQRRLEKNFNIGKDTLYRYLVDWGAYDSIDEDGGEARRKKLQEYRDREAARVEAERRRARELENEYKYKEEPYCPAPIEALGRDRLKELIIADLTLPDIARQFPDYTYEQIYDALLIDRELNTLYRQHGQKKCARKK